MSSRSWALSVIICLSLPSFARASSITDSLVSGLSCDNLSADKIMAAIPANSFDATREIPQANWAFSDGLYSLAACWSLAHAQRLFYYLGRFDNSNTDNQVPLRQVLNLMRGFDPYAFDGDRLQEWSVGMAPFPVSAIEWPSLQSPLWQMLQQGMQDPMDNGQILARNFQSEIEFYQNYRFGLLDNLQYIESDGPRPVNDNMQTVQKLISDLQKQHLTILVLRPARFSQHVVLAKSYSLDQNGNTVFQVYDSNSPGTDRTITFQNSDNEFYAASIVNGFSGVNPQAPIGVFIADEGDFTLIEKSLLQYYQTACANIGN